MARVELAVLQPSRGGTKATMPYQIAIWNSPAMKWSWIDAGTGGVQRQYRSVLSKRNASHGYHAAVDWTEA
jgi:hypothetical protein